ncbi:hypothetical protein JZ751_025851 [Albula glossodonta]|uniref:Uncharacterized protein n=1 Tax=Albula glossodonta TaxID=121402 RepID=A0A8T2NQ05_9TELE|nr:hypothetical protein JZ751_025851 [Albula glossodonta]
MELQQKLTQCMLWRVTVLRCHATTQLQLVSLEALCTGIANTPDLNLNSSSSSWEAKIKKKKTGSLLNMTNRTRMCIWSSPLLK